MEDEVWIELDATEHPELDRNAYWAFVAELDGSTSVRSLAHAAAILAQEPCETILAFAQTMSAVWVDLPLPSGSFRQSPVGWWALR